MTISASVYDQPGGDTSSILDYSRNLSGPAFIWQLRAPRPAQAEINRVAYSGKVDYKLSSHTVLSLAGNYSWYYQFSDVRTHTITAAPSAAELANPAAGFATVDANGNRTGGGFLNPNLSDTYTEWFQKTGASSRLVASATDRVSVAYQIQPSVVHKFPGLTIDYGASYSSSVTWFDFGPDNRHYKSRPKGSVTTPALTNIGFKVDRSRSLAWPSFIQTAGKDIYDLNSYTGAMTLGDSTRGGVENILSGQLNLKKDFNVGVPAWIKTGGSYQRQSRRTWSHAKTYTFLGNDGIAGNAEDNIGQFLDTSGSITSDYFHGWRPAPYASPYLAAKDLATRPERWSVDTAGMATNEFNGRRIVSESVTAAYLMGNVRLDQVSVMGGLRMEETAVKGEGPQTKSGVRSVVTREGKYRDVFPGVHLKYAPSRNWQVRGSYSTSIGRPPFGSIIPLDTVNDNAMTISASNPNLQPQHADNFDLSVEHYFEPVGVLSAGLFLKEISNFIFTDNSQKVAAGPNNGFGGQYEGYTITTSRNGGAARYRGYELAYRQQFRFLPGFWSGFGVNANFTQLQTRGDYGGTVQTDKLARFVPKYASLGISYIRGKLNLRLISVWQSEYFNGVNADPALMQYSKQRFTMNFKSEYNWTKRVRFFLDVDNLNAASVAEFYYYVPTHVNQDRIASPRYIFGIKGVL